MIYNVHLILPAPPVFPIPTFCCIPPRFCAPSTNSPFQTNILLPMAPPTYLPATNHCFFKQTLQVMERPEYPPWGFSTWSYERLTFTSIRIPHRCTICIISNIWHSLELQIAFNKISNRLQVRKSARWWKMSNNKFAKNPPKNGNKTIHKYWFLFDGGGCRIIYSRRK